ncbi:hypothetical protein LTR97_005568 [Elasticomyces elasticus]|uniref:Fe2OG dioxygenase domain-containing protein n=1 Tax=Elasticomyces elasticus TaxID=574655 RepID=A0AAN7W684_9PEZI|nr:hypothetical protein LTR97_005568 [Elasticomyces elasticus]
MEKYQVNALPSSMYYVPNFISAEEEASIFQSIPANRWVSLSHRRLQAIPSRLTAANTLLPSPLPAWLRKPVIERIMSLNGVFEGAPHGINYCLINEYLPGQGIMPHEDGGAYHPVVATVSLGGSIVLVVTEKRLEKSEKSESAGLADEQLAESKPRSWRILQEPRSLLITIGSAYTDTLHGIAEVTEDVDLSEKTIANWELVGDHSSIFACGGRNERTTRISLTLRDVKKVSSVGSKLFGKART